MSSQTQAHHICVQCKHKGECTKTQHQPPTPLLHNITQTLTSNNKQNRQHTPTTNQRHHQQTR